MYVQHGFDLRSVKHYGTSERAVAAVMKATAIIRERGVVFNILIVNQRDGDEIRFIPILNCWRVPEQGPTEVTYMGAIAREGFATFR